MKICLIYLKIKMTSSISIWFQLIRQWQPDSYKAVISAHTRSPFNHFFIVLVH